MNISLTQVGGSSADLIGASVTITNDDTSETILTTTWNGSTITISIEMGTYYTVAVETLMGYLPCANKSYLAGYQTTRNISFQYRALGGIFIEATDGTLYTSSTWTDSEKNANSIVIINGSHNFRIALVSSENKHVDTDSSHLLKNYMTSYEYPDYEAQAKQDYNGEANTDNIIRFNTAYGTNTTTYAAPWAKAYTFPDGITKGYIPACGQLNVAYQNKTSIEACLTACGGSSIIISTHFWSSTFAGQGLNDMYAGLWMIRFSDGNTTAGNIAVGNLPVRPFADYE